MSGAVTSRTSRTRPAAVPWFAFALACLPASATPLVATDDLCGGTIVANLKLDHDVIRTGPGLCVGAGGITLNLNGHTISGSSTTTGSGFGISVIGRTNVSITGGTVSNFEAGVRIMDTTDSEIKDDELRDNGEGVDFASGSIADTIKDNTFTGDRVGMNECGLKGPTDGNTLQENVLEGNAVDSCQRRTPFRQLDRWPREYSRRTS